MGSKETRRILKYACTCRLVIVALLVRPPGVNELSVCTVGSRCFEFTFGRLFVCSVPALRRRRIYQSTESTERSMPLRTWNTTEYTNFSRLYFATCS